VGGLAAQTRVTGGESIDSVGAATQGGADTISLGVGTPGTAAFSADGGADLDTAKYIGTAGPDEIGIARNATFATAFSPGSAQLDVAPSTESLVVSGLAGDDTITGQNGIGTITSLTLDGGDGDDILRGGDGADELLGGKGNDFVDGNIGADHALLGSGDDHFQWDPGDGSDTVDGQSGADTLDFNGSNIGEQITLAANGTLMHLTRNVGAVTVDTDNVEATKLRALSGADTITVDDLTGTDMTAVDVDLAATGGTGDGSADTVVTNGRSKRDVVQVTRSGSQVSVAGLAALTRITGSEPASDQLVVRTLAGNDDVTVAPDVADLIATIVDLGTDE
jgi:Ca2+-binding RTX toxin-like protein